MLSQLVQKLTDSLTFGNQEFKYLVTQQINSLKPRKFDSKAYNSYNPISFKNLQPLMFTVNVV